MRGRRLVLRAVVAAVVTGCGPTIELGDDAGSSGEGGSTGSATTSPGTTVEPPPGTTAEPPPGTTVASDDTTGADSGGATFLDGGLDLGVPPSCDLLEQDCPEGEKCVPWSSDGNPSWNASRCVPIFGDAQADDPCTAPNGPFGGYDTCGLGLMCFNVDPATDEGTCAPLCASFGGGTLGCNEPDRVCFVADVLAVCLYACDPLLVDCAAEGEGCYPWTDVFVCLPDESGDMGAPGDPCQAINSCDLGMACVNAAAVPGCVASSCCSAFCDLTDPAPSCLPGQTCTPWWEEGTWWSDIGICAASM